jgi:hypothetical protein
LAADEKTKKRIGRPPTPPDEARVALVGAWMTVGEHTWLHRLRKLRGQSMSAMCREFILGHAKTLDKQGRLYPKPPETNDEVTDASDD